MCEGLGNEGRKDVLSEAVHDRTLRIAACRNGTDQGGAAVLLRWIIELFSACFQLVLWPDPARFNHDKKEELLLQCLFHNIIEPGYKEGGIFQLDTFDKHGLFKKQSGHISEELILLEL